ncbi:MAG: glycosyltransferase, partial [Bdellovibrionota bacterium]
GGPVFYSGPPGYTESASSYGQQVFPGGREPFMGAAAVTAIIPTYKPGEELRLLLEALRSQKLPEGLDVLLVDSTGGETLATPLAKEFSARLECVRPEDFDHGTTRRKAAMDFCNSPYVAFFTQDARPLSDDVIALLLEAVRSREKVAGVYARQVPKPTATARTKSEVLSWFSPGERTVWQEPFGEKGERILPWDHFRRARFDNVASLICREAFEEIPLESAYFGEDLIWGERVLRAGYRIAYEPRALVEHSHDRSAWYEFKRTVNCHATLSELFELRTVPTPFAAFRGFFSALNEAAKQTWREAASDRRWGELMGLPGREAARAFGQYVGGFLGTYGLGERFHFRGV